MKVLLLGNRLFQVALEELGHDVKHGSVFGRGERVLCRAPAPIEDVLTQLPMGGEPELSLLGDESTFPVFLGLESLEIPLAGYAVDSHLQVHWHAAYAAIFDFIFVAQRDSLEHYRRSPQRQDLEWLPARWRVSASGFRYTRPAAPGPRSSHVPRSC